MCPVCFSVLHLALLAAVASTVAAAAYAAVAICQHQLTQQQRVAAGWGVAAVPGWHEQYDLLIQGLQLLQLLLWKCMPASKGIIGRVGRTLLLKDHATALRRFCRYARDCAAPPSHMSVVHTCVYCRTLVLATCTEIPCVLYPSQLVVSMFQLPIVAAVTTLSSTSQAQFSLVERALDDIIL